MIGLNWVYELAEEGAVKPAPSPALKRPVHRFRHGLPHRRDRVRVDVGCDARLAVSKLLGDGNEWRAGCKFDRGAAMSQVVESHWR